MIIARDPDDLVLAVRRAAGCRFFSTTQLSVERGLPKLNVFCVDAETKRCQAVAGDDRALSFCANKFLIFPQVPVSFRGRCIFICP